MPKKLASKHLYNDFDAKTRSPRPLTGKLMGTGGDWMNCVVGVVQLEQFCKANGWSLVKGRIREDNNRAWKYRIDNINGIVEIPIENNNVSHCITLEDNVWYSEEELLKLCDATTLTSALLKLQDFNITIQKGTPRINGKRVRRYKKA